MIGFGKAERCGERIDRRSVCAQPAEGGFHAQRVEVERGRDRGAFPEQVKEMRPRQVAQPGETDERKTDENKADEDKTRVQEPPLA